MPAYTEERIRQLCAEALAAKSQTDVDRIVPQLRAALEEHVKLAKESLKSQMSTIHALDAVASGTNPPRI